MAWVGTIYAYYGNCSVNCSVQTIFHDIGVPFKRLKFEVNCTFLRSVLTSNSSIFGLLLPAAALESPLSTVSLPEPHLPRYIFFVAVPSHKSDIFCLCGILFLFALSEALQKIDPVKGNC